MNPEDEHEYERFYDFTKAYNAMAKASSHILSIEKDKEPEKQEPEEEWEDVDFEDADEEEEVVEEEDEDKSSDLNVISSEKSVSFDVVTSSPSKSETGYNVVSSAQEKSSKTESAKKNLFKGND